VLVAVAESGWWGAGTLLLKINHLWPWWWALDAWRGFSSLCLSVGSLTVVLTWRGFGH
jgi:hypothetical protein